MPRRPPRTRKTKSGPAMLQQLGDRISACLERAEPCREAAASEIDERVRQQLVDLEQQWQHVVESYQFIESLERLLLHQHPLPPEVEMLPRTSRLSRDVAGRNQIPYPDIVGFGSGRIRTADMPKRLRSKTTPRVALPVSELERKIMAPLRHLKSCRKLKGADFFYVGSMGQEPNWFARPVPTRVSKACRRSF